VAVELADFVNDHSPPRDLNDLDGFSENKALEELHFGYAAGFSPNGTSL
jgi:hypothetical protein